MFDRYRHSWLGARDNDAVRSHIPRNGFIRRGECARRGRQPSRQPSHQRDFGDAGGGAAQSHFEANPCHGDRHFSVTWLLGEWRRRVSRKQRLLHRYIDRRGLRRCGRLRLRRRRRTDQNQAALCDVIGAGCRIGRHLASRGFAFLAGCESCAVETRRQCRCRCVAVRRDDINQQHPKHSAPLHIF